MPSKNLIATMSAVILGAGLYTFTPQTVAAGNVEFRLYLNDGHGAVHVGEHRKFKRHKHRRRAKCRPGRAIDHAYNFGMRRPQIERIGRKFIVVSGRKRGKWIKTGMVRRSRHCDIAWVKRIRRGHHNHGYHDRHHRMDYGYEGYYERDMGRGLQVDHRSLKRRDRRH